MVKVVANTRFRRGDEMQQTGDDERERSADQ